MTESYVLERLHLSREQEEGLLRYHVDKGLERPLAKRMNALLQNGVWDRVAMLAEAVRLLDWVVILIIFAIASTLGSWLLPTTRPFPLPSYLFPQSTSTTSTNVSTTLVSGVPTMFPYPHGSSTVPYAVVLIVSLALPFLLILFLMLFIACIPLYPHKTTASKSSTYRLRLRLANTYILGLLLSLALTLLATDILKNVIGKQRPDFWGRCGGIVQDVETISKYTIPDYGMNSANGGSGTRMVTWEVCHSYYNDVAKPATTGGIKRVSRQTLEDGWRSFPSGHASIAFAGLGYLSVFLAYAFGILGYRRKTSIGRGRRRSILALMAAVVPVFTAGYISATRYGDLMHGGIDICAGVVLGVLGAAVGWSWYAVEVQMVLERGGLGLMGEEEEEEEALKRKLPVEGISKPGCQAPVMVRVESADEIMSVR